MVEGGFVPLDITNMLHQQPIFIMISDKPTCYLKYAYSIFYYEIHSLE